MSHLHEDQEAAREAYEQNRTNPMTNDMSEDERAWREWVKVERAIAPFEKRAFLAGRASLKGELGPIRDAWDDLQEDYADISMNMGLVEREVTAVATRNVQIRFAQRASDFIRDRYDSIPRKALKETP